MKSIARRTSGAVFTLVAMALLGVVAFAGRGASEPAPSADITSAPEQMNPVLWDHDPRLRSPELKLFAGASKEYPANPMLVLELGQHSATPFSMSVDAAGRFMVTGALDKTLRVWELPNAGHKGLELIDVLRPPAADGDVGMIYAVAISPDDKLIAAGGFTGFTADDQVVYIFERISGRMVARLAVPNVAQSLAFSPDANVLVAGLGANSGLRVWRSDGAGNWSDVPVENDYADNILGLSFAKDGRLATASYDGHVRLYDKAFKRIAKVAATASRAAFGIAFSPDGRALVVGYNDSAAVELRDGHTLASLRLLERPGVVSRGESHDNLSSVAWSADGRRVFAGGRRLVLAGPRNGVGLVRRWNVTAGDAAQDLIGLGGGNTIQALRPYGRSGVLVLSQDPMIGAYDDSEKPAFRRVPLHHDMRTLRNKSDSAAFRVSRDGGVVEVPGIDFSTEQSSVRFDLKARRLVAYTVSDATLEPPRETSDRFEVLRWVNGYRPALRRRDAVQRVPLTLQQYEMSRSLAIAPSGGRFVLGTGSYLRMYDDRGQQQWERSAPSTAWRVNITPDEKLVVAAFGDGTVRWYRIEDGQELLALFIREPDEKVTDRRWIVWTPSGFYDASEGGEELIGWHINRGRDKTALFYSISRFRDVFYKQALVGNVLKTRQVPAGPPAQMLIARLPPVVRIIDVVPRPDGKATVRYMIESPSGKPIEDLRVVVDGALVDRRGVKPLVLPQAPNELVPRTDGKAIVRHTIGSPSGKPIEDLRMVVDGSLVDRTGVKALVRSEDTNELEIPLPAGVGQRQVAMSASTSDGSSDPATHGFRQDSAPPLGPSSGRLFALVVGVRKFEDTTIKALNYADRDAEEIGKALEKQKGPNGLYSNVHVKVLTNEKATREAIVEALQNFTHAPQENYTAQPDDVSLLFLSGHGLKWQIGGTGRVTDDYYFAPYDMKWKDNKVASSGVPYSEILRFIRNAKGKKLVFLDTCYSGQLGELDGPGMANLIGTSEGGAMVWASSSALQESRELPEHKHGAFTVALLDAIYGRQGAGAYRKDNGRITQNQLTTWFDYRVPRLTQNRQTPIKVDRIVNAVEVVTVIPQSQ